MGLVDAVVARGPGSALRGEAETLALAPPERVYHLLSDVTRIGEWSPECYRCEWLDGATTAAVGARFRGDNRRGWIKWSTTCRVTEATPGQVFAFEVMPAMNRVQSQWRYELEPVEGGTLLRESFRVLWYLRPVVLLLFGGAGRRQARLEEGARRSLARIKALAEAQER